MNDVTQLTDDELEAYVDNYRRKNKIEGGKFPFSEVLLEQIRRKPAVFSPRETARKIIELAQNSPDGLCTYGQIWSAFRPKVPWVGHKTMKPVKDSLGQVVRFCHMNNLPILSTLVVEAGKRELSPKAVQNIYSLCRELGMDVGPDPNSFVLKQADLARALSADNLPSEVEPSK